MDAAEWAKRTSVPVFPGKVNTWVLVRGSADDADAADVEGQARAVLPLFWGYLSNVALGMHILNVQTSRKELGADVAGIAKRPYPGVATAAVEGDPPWWVMVEFIAPPEKTSLPWPMLDLDGQWVPSMQDEWMLWKVIDPRDPTKEEKPFSLLDAAKEAASDVAEAASSAAAPAKQAWSILPIVLVVALGAAAYTWLSPSKR